MVPWGRSWDVECPFLSVCESCRILEYLGGDDPLLILRVNRGRSIGAGAYLLGRSGLLGVLGRFSPFPPWFSRALGVLSPKSFPDGLGASRAIEGCPPLLSWAPSFCPIFMGFFTSVWVWSPSLILAFTLLKLAAYLRLFTRHTPVGINPSYGIGSWTACGPSFLGHCLPCPLPPLPDAGLGLTSRSELVS